MKCKATKLVSWEQSSFPSLAPNQSLISLIKSVFILICSGLSIGEELKNQVEPHPSLEVFNCIFHTPPRLAYCRVRLSKRRAKAGVQSGTNALLVVKHRDMNEKELEAQVTITTCSGHPRGVWWWVKGTQKPDRIFSLPHCCFPGGTEGPVGEP